MMARILAAAGVLCASAAVVADQKFSTKRLSQAKKGYYEAKSSYPAFSGRGIVLALANGEIAKEARADFGRFVNEAKQEARFGRPTAAWGYEATTVVALATDSLVSVYFDRYSYSGGAHPNTFQLPLNFGLVAGKAKRLKLEDVLKPGSAGVVMSQIVRPRLNAAKGARGGDPIETIDKDLNNSFVVTRAGMTWLFPAYSVGPYAEGSYEIKVPWSDLAPHLAAGGPLSSVRR
ncbi:MAG TPA: DUF3298 and DUF4163 domain-containing protein [Fimbriimonadaceae bacterium]|nr:DUF3298 and DUF4163 domain-containing protein [Fimbriimonadaceae bacterium]HRJ97235.1 DUF3298 and DUF4163 domain-containing protein [Fimbriimonadaceae bacterium]